MVADSVGGSVLSGLRFSTDGSYVAVNRKDAYVLMILEDKSLDLIFIAKFKTEEEKNCIDSVFINLPDNKLLACLHADGLIKVLCLSENKLVYSTKLELENAKGIHYNE